MTAALGPWMMRHPEVKNNMEAFVLQFVTPEFAAQEGYIRAIVSFLFIFITSYYYFLNFSDVLTSVDEDRLVKWWAR